jgi:hypothetical protein
VLAATPAWFSDNLPQIAIGTLALLTLLVLRLVQKVALRATLLALIAAAALFVYVNRAPIEACARTCECTIAGRDITVPTCDPDLSL